MSFRSFLLIVFFRWKISWIQNCSFQPSREKFFFSEFPNNRITIDNNISDKNFNNEYMTISSVNIISFFRHTACLPWFPAVFHFLFRCCYREKSLLQNFNRQLSIWERTFMKTTTEFASSIGVLIARKKTNKQIIMLYTAIDFLIRSNHQWISCILVSHNSM